MLQTGRALTSAAGRSSISSDRAQTLVERTTRAIAKALLTRKPAADDHSTPVGFGSKLFAVAFAPCRWRRRASQSTVALMAQLTLPLCQLAITNLDAEFDRD